MRAYVAGPLFNAAERRWNLEVTDALQRCGLTTYLPQRDTAPIGPTDQLSDQARRRVFDEDLAAIRQSDLLVILLDGRVPDEGACMELGFAHALGKPCFALLTDSRSSGSINLMLEFALVDNRPADSLDHLVERVSRLLLSGS